MSKFYPDQKFQYLVLYLTRSPGRYSHNWSTLGDFLSLETHKAFSLETSSFLLETHRISLETTAIHLRPPYFDYRQIQFGGSPTKSYGYPRKSGVSDEKLEVSYKNLGFSSYEVSKYWGSPMMLISSQTP